MHTLILDNSRKCFEYLSPKISTHQEEVWALALNPELRLLAGEMVFRGTVQSCPLHPRELFRFLILNSASSFVLAHNHPTGLALPSRSDLLVTRRMWKLANLIEIPMNDHVILGTDGYASLADRGFLANLRPYRD